MGCAGRTVNRNAEPKRLRTSGLASGSRTVAGTGRCVALAVTAGTILCGTADRTGAGADVADRRSVDAGRTDRRGCVGAEVSPNQLPALVSLALDIGFGRLTLGVEGVEVLLEPVANGQAACFWSWFRFGIIVICNDSSAGRPLTTLSGHCFPPCGTKIESKRMEVVN